jgi:hypothetical protein
MKRGRMWSISMRRDEVWITGERGGKVTLPLRPSSLCSLPLLSLLTAFCSIASSSPPHPSLHPPPCRALDVVGIITRQDLLPDRVEQHFEPGLGQYSTDGTSLRDEASGRGGGGGGGGSMRPRLDSSNGNGTPSVPGSPMPSGGGRAVGGRGAGAGGGLSGLPPMPPGPGGGSNQHGQLH